MATTDLTISNLALRLLKAQKIGAVGDGSKNANVLDDVYGHVREQLLSHHNWNFATKRAKLAANATDPIFGFDNTFDLPSGWLRTVSVHDNDAGAGSLLYRQESGDYPGIIVTSADEVWMRYVWTIVDPAQFTSGFTMAFSYALAVAMPGISNLSAGGQDKLERKATKVLRQAKFTDAVGSSPEARPAGSWVTVRGGYPGWRAWPD